MTMRDLFVVVADLDAENAVVVRPAAGERTFPLSALLANDFGDFQADDVLKKLREGPLGSDTQVG